MHPTLCFSAIHSRSGTSPTYVRAAQVQALGVTAPSRASLAAGSVRPARQLRGIRQRAGRPPDPSPTPHMHGCTTAHHALTPSTSRPGRRGRTDLTAVPGRPRPAMRTSSAHPKRSLTRRGFIPVVTLARPYARAALRRPSSSRAVPCTLRSAANCSFVVCSTYAGALSLLMADWLSGRACAFSGMTVN